MIYTCLAVCITNVTYALHMVANPNPKPKSYFQAMCEVELSSQYEQCADTALPHRPHWPHSKPHTGHTQMLSVIRHASATVKKVEIVRVGFSYNNTTSNP